MHRPYGAAVSNIFKLALVSVLLLRVTETQAACTLTAGAGNDFNICDSSISSGLTDLNGNNTLTFPPGGSGIIAGNVLFGAAADSIEMNSGSIQGTVNQGAGEDTLTIRSGTITGAIQQGSGIDRFVMSGGTVLSLSQGDGRDTFSMTGGTITGAFEDGDIAAMSGGGIGRVDMKLDDNIFNLSGGRIVGNLVTGFGRDSIIVSGGSIGGNISVSGGNDSLGISGGVIGGEVRMSAGDDTLNWSNGGEIHSAVLMGDGNDSAYLSNLSEALLALTPVLDGGLGNDQLTFDHTLSSGAARYVGWEVVNLTGQSHFNLDGDFFLGDSVSGTGAFSIDADSTLSVTQGSIRPYNAGQLTTLNNAGVIDMRNGVAGDRLTLYGNYLGNNGQLQLETVLGDERSVTDQLAVSQGTLSGNTQLGITNLNGLGALTRDSGIEVVQALNGATSSNTAFALQRSLSAGAFEYQLFKGGVTAGTENNWYLRSSVVAIPALASPPAASPVVVSAAPAPLPVSQPVVGVDEPPVEPPTATPVAPAAVPQQASMAPAAVSPIPAASSPLLPSAVPGAEPVPLYRLEVPVYSVIVPAAQLMTLSALGTFHDRQGATRVLRTNGAAPAGWGRIYSRDVRKSWSGTVAPHFDGADSGYQVGQDIYAATTATGQLQHIGLFVGKSHLQGDVDGFAEGFQHRNAGQLKLDGDHIGVYWTLINPDGGYLDAVAMGSRLNGTSRSDRGVRLDTQGRAVTLSLESGYPFPVTEHWVLEPQVQIIKQHIRLDTQNDGISDVSFASQDYWTGRTGVRFKGHYQLDNIPIEPYVRANLWRTFGGKDTVTYNGIDRIKTDHQSVSFQSGLGLVAEVSQGVSVYLGADYSTRLDSLDHEGISGSLGIRVSW
jgi:outer membrane autotransporter protein